MKRVALTSLLCLALCVASAAEPDATQPVSAAQSFVSKATQDGLMEIELGKLAQTRSSNAKVKEFAAHMVEDHTKTNDELATLAKRRSLEVPTALDDDHARKVHAVSSKPPSEFDFEYGKRMVEAHDTAITLFMDASAVGDKEIARFAEEALPTLRKHQQLAAELPTKRPRPADADAVEPAPPTQ